MVRSVDPTRPHARTSATPTDDAPRPIIRAFVLTPRLSLALWVLFWVGVCVFVAALVFGESSAR